MNETLNSDSDTLIEVKMSEKQKLFRIVSIIILLLGVLLVTYMIIVENELGVIPLLLLISGIILVLISYFKKQLK